MNEDNLRSSFRFILPGIIIIIIIQREYRALMMPSSEFVIVSASGQMWADLAGVIVLRCTVIVYFYFFTFISRFVMTQRNFFFQRVKQRRKNRY